MKYARLPSFILSVATVSIYNAQFAAVIIPPAAIVSISFFDLNSFLTSLNLPEISTIRKLQKHMGISRENTMAFGDNLNDIGMLEQAVMSYAVEEAREEVRAAAGAIAGSCRSDGVLNVLKEFLRGI